MVLRFRRPLSPTRRRRRRLVVGGLALALALGWGWHARRTNLKRLAVVRPGVLLRVGQPTEVGLEELVWRSGARTVVSTQWHEVRLYRNVWDLGRPNGELEAPFVRRLGAQHLQWPLGSEAGWPWPNPWVLEAFLRLMDDPAAWPVVIHCQGGRHRTGTLSAIYRLEYDRWPVERVLEEMHSFDFGPVVAVQDHNLRTYWPRPWPAGREWITLTRQFNRVLPATALADYPALVRALRGARNAPAIESRLDHLLCQARPFALCLAQRLIDSPDDPLTEAALAGATTCLESLDANPQEWSAAAALVADFGSPTEQGRLLELLAGEPLQGPVSARYRALAQGVTNRYTLNRLPYWKVLLGDTRAWPDPGAAGARIADTAVARMVVTLNQPLLGVGPERARWDQGQLAARTWFDEHRHSVQLVRLQPAGGALRVAAETGQRHEEDLSRLR